MAPSFIEQFNSARRASAPLVLVRTPDGEATMKTISMNKFNASSAMILHDCVRGIRPVNNLAASKAIVQKLAPTDDKQREIANPVEMLAQAHRMEKESVLFMANLHRFFQDPQIVQGIANLRSAFKQDTRTLVILSPDATLPPEIAQDVVMLDEPLPNAAQLEGIVLETYKAVSQLAPEDKFMARAVDALCGLAAFSAEQVCAMSIGKSGLDLDSLWERKRQQIEQTPGLSVWRGKERFSDIGGCGNIKQFLSGILNGKERPRAIVFQDEIEKALAGASGDLSGTTQELLGSQLSFMQDHKSTGLLLLGVPGAAKSAIAKAFGNEAEIPLIQFDIGSMKGSLVGESNANMRTGLKVVEAVSQGRALWIATCNNIDNLPPELRRRYVFGTFFFDLPTKAEREMIWNIYFEKFQIKDRKKPMEEGWTGAEIENCCVIANKLQITPVEAATYVIPLAQSDKDRIRKLRNEASDRYISAAYAGPYKAPAGLDPEEEPAMLVAVGMIQPKGRKINIGDLEGDGGKSKKKEPVN
jgi:hypothetical protein